MSYSVGILHCHRHLTCLAMISYSKVSPRSQPQGRTQTAQWLTNIGCCCRLSYMSRYIFLKNTEVMLGFCQSEFICELTSTAGAHRLLFPFFFFYQWRKRFSRRKELKDLSFRTLTASITLQ